MTSTERTDRLLVFRAAREESAQLPLEVRSVGRYQLPAAWSEDPKEKPFSQLFWLAAGRAEFRLDEKWIAARAGQVFVYPPNSVHHIRSCDTSVQYCFITLDHPDSEQWLCGFGLQPGVSSAGTCPQDLFLAIATALQHCTAAGARKAAHLAHEILLLASTGSPPSEDEALAGQIKNICDANFHNPNLGISQIADELQMHRSTIFRCFRQHYGISPSRYLRGLRAQKALALLRSENCPIHEVATQAGFVDPNYLSRCVRDITGMSPLEFRKHVGVGTPRTA